MDPNAPKAYSKEYCDLVVKSHQEGLTLAIKALNDSTKGQARFTENALNNIIKTMQRFEDSDKLNEQQHSEIKMEFSDKLASLRVWILTGAVSVLLIYGISQWAILNYHEQGRGRIALVVQKMSHDFNTAKNKHERKLEQLTQEVSGW